MNKKIKQASGLKFVWLAVVVLVIDIITKILIVYNFRLSQSERLFPFFSITYIRNYGAAFGLFIGQRWLLILISLIVTFFIIAILYRSPVTERISNIGFSLMMGGGIGNLCNRLYNGYVIDFIDFNLKNWHYPAFNVADSAICIGAVLLLLAHFSEKGYRKNETVP